MTDNFELIKSLLRFNRDGDCYYLQLLRRASDDPRPDGNPDPNYHGNMHSRSVKDYFIKSIEHLESVEPEIKTLCRQFNVRAYIRLNKRTYKGIALQMLKHIAEQCASGESYSSPHHMVSSAAGKANCADMYKTWLVDLDKEYLPYEVDICKMVCACDPIRRQFQAESYGIVATVPTKNGKHLIVRPFNRKEFSDQWRSFATTDLKEPDIHKDNPTILYVP